MKKEKNILRNYLEYISKNYKEFEPNCMSDSMCEIYDRLEKPSWLFRTIIVSVFAYSFVCIFVLVVNTFWRKTR